MLATPVAKLPVGEQWAYEFKWDGVRALLDVRDGRVRITSRNGNDVTAGYPELVALAADAGDALLDGEFVAFVDGRPSFQRLQSRMHVRAKAEVQRLAAECPVAFVAFDLLRRYGVDLTGRPWRERRATLERWLADADGWTISPSFDDAAATEQVARAAGLEGVVAKRVDAPYRPGARSDDWRKLRFGHADEFVVIGWEAPTERPTDLSSLVLATRSGDGWELAGKVGSGLSAAAVRVLRPLLVPRDEPVVTGVPRSPGRVVRWVEPTVVVDVAYAARTDDHRLRHPVFRGVRTDKRPEEATGDG
ncbi:MAG: non-homologous end-joining DNA ligase [Jatrophihabitans sp.]|uniref:non-homologous end-joining DNA ligase n=1 Tax=Jatrophihabitans sp. TaxID=1932789 RepID=UPI003F7F5E53